MYSSSNNIYPLLDDNALLETLVPAHDVVNIKRLNKIISFFIVPFNINTKNPSISMGLNNLIRAILNLHLFFTKVEGE